MWYLHSLNVQSGASSLEVVNRRMFNPPSTIKAIWILNGPLKFLALDFLKLHTLIHISYKISTPIFHGKSPNQEKLFSVGHDLTPVYPCHGSHKIIYLITKAMLVNLTIYTQFVFSLSQSLIYFFKKSYFFLHVRYRLTLPEEPQVPGVKK